MVRPETISPGIITEAMDAAGLVAGLLSLLWTWRTQRDQRRDLALIREEADRGYQECLRKIEEICESLAAAERNAQASLELLRNGRLGIPVRARAFRMLRAGMAADTAAAELGLAKKEVQLLGRIAVLLAPGS